jgi:serine/threonine-protein kinase
VAALESQVRAAKAVGPYRLIRPVGSGGMGDVYLAEHRLLKRPCAVKLVRPERAGDPGALSRFEREVRATARLRHPNTVEVYDYGRADDGTFYYVMEFLDGLPLDRVVAEYGPLPPGRAVRVLRQLCGALREAHALGLVHRDVKPGNVLLCRQAGEADVAKLVDFGLVRPPDGLGAGDLTRVGMALGTPDYMPPEQAEGRPVDGRSDLYGVGGTAYFLLTGSPPYPRQTALAALVAHRHAPPPELPPGVPAGLAEVVRRCLAKEPAERFPDAAALERALAGCDPGGWSDEDARAWWAAVPADRMTG